MQVMQALLLVAAVLVAHVIVATRALGAYVQFLSARGVRVAVEAWMLLTLVFAPRVFALCALALALIAGRTTWRAVSVRWAALRITRRNLGKSARVPARLRLPLVQAIAAEVGITTMRQHRIAWRHMMETRHISPIPKLIDVDERPSATTYTARLNAAGFTAAKFEEFGDGIRTYIGASRRVDIYGDDQNGQIVHVRIVHTDATDKLLGAWPHLNDQPGSHTITEGVPTGINSNGDDARLSPVDDAVFVSGQRGTGKSVYMQQVVAYAALCHDVELWLCDGKEGAEFGLWRGKVHRLAETPEEIDVMVGDLLVERLRRSHVLKKLGLRKWEPGCGLKFLFVAIDEVAELSMGDVNSAQSKLTKLVRLGRAQGIGFIAATQRPSNKWVDTSLRAQCNVSVCFRVRDAIEAGIAMGSGTVADGLRPHKLPKYRYIMLDDAEQSGLRHVGWNLSDTQIRAIAARLPDAVQERSDPGYEAGSDRTAEQAPIEPLMDPPDPESDGPGTEPPDLDAKPARARVWQVLVDHPEWMPPSSIQKLAGASKDTVFSSLREWLEAGYVEAAGGRYRRRGPRDWRSDLAS